jgi:LSD1 subclass zinc finger protein
MPLAIPCSNCRATLKIPDAAVGKKVRCPKCQSVVVAEAADPEFEVVEQESTADAKSDFEVVDESPRRKPKLNDDPPPRKKKKKKRKPVFCPECDDEVRPEDTRCSCGARLTPTRMLMQQEDAKHSGRFGLEKRILSGGVVGGAIAMLIAAAWFSLGLQADRVYFYPPVLFVIGFISLIKGLLKSEESED